MDSDQGSDIEIPIIQITEGWTVDDLQSQDDCDDAHAYLTGAICAIEDKIDKAMEDGHDAGQGYRALKRALRWKKAALSVVQTRRGKISRADRRAEHLKHEARFSDLMRKMFPAEFAAVVRAADNLGESDGT